MRISLAVLTVGALAIISLPASAQDVPNSHPIPARKSRPEPDQRQLPLKYSGGPTGATITAGDLMTRLYLVADDSMMGRQAGTIYNDKATDYIEREVRRLGLKPAGENGTYFQSPLVTHEVLGTSTLGTEGHAYELWKDFAPRDQGPQARSFAGVPTIYGGRFGDTASYLAPEKAEGKVVVVMVGNGPDGAPNFNAINRPQLNVRYANAAGIAVIYLDYAPPGYVDAVFRHPGVTEKQSQEGAPALPSYFYITRALAQDVFGTTPDSLTTGQEGKPFTGDLRFEQRPAPGRNVIAILPGSDPTLAGEYVAIGAHNDHIGFNDTPMDHDSVRAFMEVAAPQGADSPEPKVTAEQWVRINAMIDSLRKAHPARTDSIYNGADDDGSGTVSVLEIAEAFARSNVRPKRSILFIWHVGEELGLFGSEYFTDNPTVSRDSIVAELNMDMVGRGGAQDVTGVDKAGQLLHGGEGYVQLVGSRRLSTELGDMIEKVNVDKRLGLRFDYALDANGHPQNIYCRSDHYEYARYGIPIAFFTTGGHADYHQVTDEPQYIDYNRMAQIARLVQQSAIAVGNLDHRVSVDQPRPDPHGSCRQ